MDKLTYEEVGATRHGPLPERPAGRFGGGQGARYRHLTHRTYLGRGVLPAAREALLSWRMQEAAGVRVQASAPRAAPGVTITSRIGLGRFRLSAPCQVVWTVDDDHQAGFAYGTLPGHPARGEESFVVTRTDQDEVWFTVTSFSVPARWFMRAAGPLAPVLQRAFAYGCGRALRRLCRVPGECPPSSHAR